VRPEEQDDCFVMEGLAGQGTGGQLNNDKDVPLAARIFNVSALTDHSGKLAAVTTGS